MRKTTAIYTGFIALALVAGASVSSQPLGSLLADFITPSEYGVEYYFPPETQEGVVLKPNTHNYVSCTLDGTPSILQSAFADDSSRTYWIREEPPLYSRSSVQVRGNAPTTLFENIGGRWRSLWTRNRQSSSATPAETVSDDEKVHFYSSSVLALRPELAAKSTLTTFKGGVLYYIKTDEDLEFVCPEGVLCGDGQCEEGESALICPENQPCVKSCEADCGAAPVVQDFCLPCGETCEAWHMGQPSLGCSANTPGMTCAFESGVCIQTNAASSVASSQASQEPASVTCTDPSLTILDGTVDIGYLPSRIVAGDFNGDGNGDIASLFNPSNISVHFGNGNDSFNVAGVIPNYEWTNMTTGDFNGDGNTDIAAIRRNPSHNGGYYLHTFLGSNNSFIQAEGVRINTSSHSNGIVNAMTTGDLNGDGNLDIVTANRSNSVSIFIGDGNGFFGGFPGSFGASNNPNDITLADFNDDGNIDIATGNSTDPEIAILFGDGNGSVDLRQSFAIETTNPPAPFTTSDFNGDGYADLAMENDSVSTVSILFNDGNGTFTNSSDVTVDADDLDVNLESVISGDFNADGHADIATANGISDTVSIVFGDGSGSFSTPSHFTVSGPNQIITYDFNGDGVPDIATSNRNGTATFLLSECTSSISSTSSTAIASSQPSAPVACNDGIDNDGDGDIDLETKLLGRFDYGNDNLQSPDVLNRWGTRAPWIDSGQVGIRGEVNVLDPSGDYMYQVSLADDRGKQPPGDVGLIARRINVNTMSLDGIASIDIPSEFYEGVAFKSVYLASMDKPGGALYIISKYESVTPENAFQKNLFSKLDTSTMEFVDQIELLPETTNRIVDSLIVDTYDQYAYITYVSPNGEHNATVRKIDLLTNEVIEEKVLNDLPTNSANHFVIHDFKTKQLYILSSTLLTGTPKKVLRATLSRISTEDLSFQGTVTLGEHDEEALQATHWIDGNRKYGYFQLDETHIVKVDLGNFSIEKITTIPAAAILAHRKQLLEVGNGNTDLGQNSEIIRHSMQVVGFAEDDAIGASSNAWESSIQAGQLALGVNANRVYDSNIYQYSLGDRGCLNLQDTSEEHVPAIGESRSTRVALQQSTAELIIIEPTTTTQWQPNTLQTLRWTAPANPNSFVPYSDEFMYEYSLDNGATWIMANDSQTAFRNGNNEYQMYATIYNDASECISSPHGCQQSQFAIGFPQLVLFYGLRTQTNPQVAVGQQASFRLPDDAQSVQFRVMNVANTALTDTTINITRIASVGTIASSQPSSLATVVATENTTTFTQCSVCEQCGVGIGLCSASKCTGQCVFEQNSVWGVSILGGSCTPSPQLCQSNVQSLQPQICKQNPTINPLEGLDIPALSDVYADFDPVGRTAYFIGTPGTPNVPTTSSSASRSLYALHIDTRQVIEYTLPHRYHLPPMVVWSPEVQKLFLFGGAIYEGDTPTASANIYAFTPADTIVEFVGVMPKSRTVATPVRVPTSGDIYLFFGNQVISTTQSPQFLTDVAVFNPRTGVTIIKPLRISVQGGLPRIKPVVFWNNATQRIALSTAKQWFEFDTNSAEVTPVETYPSTALLSNRYGTYVVANNELVNMNYFATAPDFITNLATRIRTDFVTGFAAIATESKQQHGVASYINNSGETYTPIRQQYASVYDATTQRIYSIGGCGYGQDYIKGRQASSCRTVLEYCVEGSCCSPQTPLPVPEKQVVALQLGVSNPVLHGAAPMECNECEQCGSGAGDFCEIHECTGKCDYVRNSVWGVPLPGGTCTSKAECSLPPPVACADGIDNDNDGGVDVKSELIGRYEDSSDVFRLYEKDASIKWPYVRENGFYSDGTKAFAILDPSGEYIYEGFVSDSGKSRRKLTFVKIATDPMRRVSAIDVPLDASLKATADFIDFSRASMDQANGALYILGTYKNVSTASTAYDKQTLTKIHTETMEVEEQILLPLPERSNATGFVVDTHEQYAYVFFQSSLSFNTAPSIAKIDLVTNELVRIQQYEDLPSPLTNGKFILQDTENQTLYFTATQTVRNQGQPLYSNILIGRINTEDLSLDGDASFRLPNDAIGLERSNNHWLDALYQYGYFQISRKHIAKIQLEPFSAAGITTHSSSDTIAVSGINPYKDQILSLAITDGAMPIKQITLSSIAAAGASDGIGVHSNAWQFPMPLLSVSIDAKGQFGYTRDLYKFALGDAGCSDAADTSEDSEVVPTDNRPIRTTPVTPLECNDCAALSESECTRDPCVFEPFNGVCQAQRQICGEPAPPGPEPEPEPEIIPPPASSSSSSSSASTTPPPPVATPLTVSTELTSSVNAFNTVTFTLEYTFTNATTAAQNVSFVQEMPANTTASNPEKCTRNTVTRALTCSVGALAPNETKTLSISLQFFATMEGSVGCGDSRMLPQSVVTTTTTGIVIVNNQPQSTVISRRCSGASSSTPPPPLPGTLTVNTTLVPDTGNTNDSASTLTFTITNGTRSAENVVLVQPMHTDTFALYSGPCAFSKSTNQVMCNFRTIAPGATVTQSFSVRVKNYVTCEASTLRNLPRSTVTTTTTDITVQNNQPDPTVISRRCSGASTLTVNTNLVPSTTSDTAFTMNYTFINGSREARDVTFRQPLLSDVVSYYTGPCTNDGTAVSCNLGRLAPGATVTQSLTIILMNSVACGQTRSLQKTTATTSTTTITVTNNQPNSTVLTRRCSGSSSSSSSSSSSAAPSASVRIVTPTVGTVWNGNVSANIDWETSNITLGDDILYEVDISLDNKQTWTNIGGASYYYDPEEEVDVIIRPSIEDRTGRCSLRGGDYPSISLERNAPNSEKCTAVPQMRPGQIAYVRVTVKRLNPNGTNTANMHITIVSAESTPFTVAFDESPLRACAEADNWTTVSSTPFNTSDTKLTAGVFGNSIITYTQGLHRYSADEAWHTIGDKAYVLGETPKDVLVVRGDTIFMGKFYSYANQRNLKFETWSAADGFNMIRIPGSTPGTTAFASIAFEEGDYIEGIYEDTDAHSFYIKRFSDRYQRSFLHLINVTTIEAGQLYSATGVVEQRMQPISYNTTEQNLEHNGVEYEVSDKGAIRCRKTPGVHQGTRGIFGELPVDSGLIWDPNAPATSLEFSNQCRTSDELHRVQKDINTVRDASYGCAKFIFAHDKLYCSTIVRNSRENPFATFLKHTYGFFVIEGGQNTVLVSQALRELEGNFQQNIYHQFFVADDRVFVGTWLGDQNQRTTELALYEMSDSGMVDLGTITASSTNGFTNWTDVTVVSGVPYAVTSYGQVVRFESGEATTMRAADAAHYRDAPQLETIGSTLYLGIVDTLFAINGNVASPITMEFPPLVADRTALNGRKMKDMIAIENMLYFIIGDTVMAYDAASSTWSDTDLTLTRRFASDQFPFSLFDRPMLDAHRKGNDLVIRTADRIMQLKNGDWYELFKHPSAYSSVYTFGMTDQFIYETDSSSPSHILCRAYPSGTISTASRSSGNSFTASLLSTVGTSKQTLPILTLFALVMIGGYLYSHKRQ
ncbi:MAG: VCBS repeat-containing protein [bacterium]|nr:VCBS repeat-containing protein [bacterium]